MDGEAVRKRHVDRNEFNPGFNQASDKSHAARKAIEASDNKLGSIDPAEPKRFLQLRPAALPTALDFGQFGDGSSLSITIPDLGSGVQFEGFTDAGKLISSVEINTTSAASTSGDWVGVDDVRFVAGDPPVIRDPGPAVPESSTWAMMLLGFVGLGYAAHLRARRASVISP